MTIRYLAIVSERADESSAASSRHLEVSGLNARSCCAGLTLLTDTPNGILPLPDAAGFIVGPLFRRSDGSTVAALDEWQTAQVVATGGRWLLDHCWGGYVAMLRDKSLLRWFIVREPSGSVPCYYAALGETTVFASEVGFLFETHLIRPEIDWSQLAAFLLAADLRSPSTALAGVAELLPGTRMTIAQERSIDAWWSPWNHVHPPRRADGWTSQARLRGLVRDCVSAWSRGFDHLLLGVSGGLDSSIVAACLARTGARINCFTMATRSGDGDERSYARLIASAKGLALHEAFFDVARIDVTRSVACHLPRPTGAYFGQEVERVMLALTAELGVDGVCSGGGGDNVFGYMQSATPVVDRLLSDDTGAEIWKTALDVCQLTGCSIWTVLRHALMKLPKSRRRYLWRPDVSLLDREVIAQGPARFDHPWLATPRDALPGKALHIALLLRIQNHLDGYQRPMMPPMIAPLLSQPIVEFCLSIPSWQWCEDGLNRAVARRAFREDLPDQILARRSKGGPDSFSMEIFDVHRAALRELLLDGHLARQGIIDRRAVDNALTSTRSLPAKDRLRVLSFANAESWVRSWMSRASPAHAPQHGNHGTSASASQR